MDEIVYCVSYDLRKSDRNYNDLYTAIKSFGTWWHQTESVWFVKSTNRESSTIREYLKQFIDENDLLFVIRVENNWAGFGFSKEEYNWLHNNLK